MSDDWASCDLFDSSLCSSRLRQEKNELAVEALESVVGPRLLSVCGLPGESVVFSPAMGSFQSFQLEGIERPQWRLKNSHLLKRNDAGENREATRTCGKQDSGAEKQISTLSCFTGDGHPRDPPHSITELLSVAKILPTMNHSYTRNYCLRIQRTKAKIHSP